MTKSHILGQCKYLSLFEEKILTHEKISGCSSRW